MRQTSERGLLFQVADAPAGRLELGSLEIDVNNYRGSWLIYGLITPAFAVLSPCVTDHVAYGQTLPKSQTHSFVKCGNIEFLCISDDGTYIVTYTRDRHEVSVWKTADGSRAQQIVIPEEFIPETLSLTKKGVIVLSSRKYGATYPAVRSWDAATGRALGSQDNIFSPQVACLGKSGLVACLVRKDSPDRPVGYQLLMRILELPSLKPINDIPLAAQLKTPEVDFVLESNTGEVYVRLRETADSRNDRVVAVCDLHKAKVLRETEIRRPHDHMSWLIRSQSPDGRFTAEGPTLFHLESGEPVASVVLRQHSVFSPDGNLVCTNNPVLGYAGFRTWDIQAGKELTPHAFFQACGLDDWEVIREQVRWTGFDKSGRYAAFCIFFEKGAEGAEGSEGVVFVADQLLKELVCRFPFDADNFNAELSNGLGQWKCLSMTCFSESGAVIAAPVSDNVVMIGNIPPAIEEYKTAERKWREQVEADAKKHEADAAALAMQELQEKQDAELLRQLRRPPWRESVDLVEEAQRFLADVQMSQSSIYRFVKYGSPDMEASVRDGDRFDREDAEGEIQEHHKAISSRSFYMQAPYRIDPYGEKPAKVTLGVSMPVRCMVNSGGVSPVLVADLLPGKWYRQDETTLRPCEGEDEARQREGAGQDIYIRENTDFSELLVGVVAERDVLKRLLRAPEAHVVNIKLENLRLFTPPTAGFFRKKGLESFGWDCGALRERSFIGLQPNGVPPLYWHTPGEPKETVAADITAVEVVHVALREREVIFSWGKK